MTWEEVCADPLLADLPYKIELNQWVNIEISPARARHGEFQGEIAYLLRSMKPDGYAITECPIKTSENVKVPDVVWIPSGATMLPPRLRSFTPTPLLRFAWKSSLPAMRLRS